MDHENITSDHRLTLSSVPEKHLAVFGVVKVKVDRPVVFLVGRQGPDVPGVFDEALGA